MDYDNMRAGFTLIETMVVVFIFTIMIAAVFIVLGTGRNAWLTGDTNIEVEQELRKAKEWMSKELIQGRYSTAAVSADNSSIDFEIPSNVADGGYISWQQVEYRLGGENNNQLLTDIGGAPKVIANNIGSVEFTQDSLDPRSLSVAVASSVTNFKQRVVSQTLNFNIKFRN